MKPFLLLAVLVAGLSPAAVSSPPFKVRTLPIAMLAQDSDLIIEATVTKVEVGASGTRVARCTPTATWKGQPNEVVEFLASPTWACDISTAVPGERVVLFLEVDEAGQLCIFHSGRGRMPRRELAGREYATFHGEISFPENTVTTFDKHVAGSYNQGVEIGELKRLVAQAIEAARQAAEQGAGK